MDIVSLMKKYFTNAQLQSVSEQQESVCIRNAEILFHEQGFAQALIANKCIDMAGQPIPWYTYPAIEYISQFDLTAMNIFEYGCGNSSLFWASRAKKVVSIENNQEWYNKILDKAPENLELLLRDTREEYINCIDDFDLKFDIIVIDGAYRYDTSEKALSRISSNGLIIIDNSDRAVAFDEYSSATRLLRKEGFIQADMSGFGPLNRYTWTTSFFFTKEFNFKTADDIQPHKPVGGNVQPVKR